MRDLMIPVLRSAPRILRVFAAFAPRVRSQAGPLGAALVLGLVVAATEVLKPWPLQLVFDAVLLPRTEPVGGPAATLLRWAAEWPTSQVIWTAAAVLVGISALGGVATFAQTVLLSETGQRVVTRLRRDLFRHLLVLPPVFHSSRRHGDLLTRLTGDIVLLRELLVGGLTDSVGAGVTLLATLGVMLWLDARLTLITLAIVPLVAIVGSIASERIRGMVRRNRDKEGALAANAGEALGAVAVLQAFGATDHAAEMFERGNRSALRAGLKASRVEAVLARALDLLTSAGLGVTLILGVDAVQRGTLTPGGLLVFLAYQRTLYRPVRQLARLAARAAKGAACGERVLEVLQTRPAIEDARDARACPVLRGDVRLEDVHVHYPRGDRALTAVSLHIPAGSLAVLRGESGSGKSTLLALLPRLIDPTRGVVRIDDVDVREWTLASLRRQVAVVSQEATLLGWSVRENIRLGDPEADDDAIQRAAEHAGVTRFSKDLPQGLDTIVGERGAQLSGGQRQRVALARAALRDAPVLVLDEPFAHLDALSRDHVLAALRRVAAGRTVLLVTHQDHPGLIPDLEFTLAGGRLSACAGLRHDTLRAGA